MESGINNMCRCCASEGTYKDVKSTYHWMGEQEVYSEMLRDCFDITLCQLDEADASGICEVCITQLRNAYNFKKQVQVTEEQFKRRLEDKDLLSFKTNIVKVEVTPEDEENESDNDHNASEDYSGTEFEVPIKHEVVEEKKVTKKRAAQPSTSRAKKPKVEVGESSKQTTSSCQICNYRTPSTYNMKRHLLNKHKIDALTTKKKLCEDCGNVFFNDRYFARHLAKGCPGSNTKICVKCNIKFHRKSEMFEHMRTKHWSEYQILKFNCPMCDATLNNHDEHDFHLSSEHNVKLDYQELTFGCDEGTDGPKRRKKKKGDASATPERVEHRVNLTSILQFSNASPFRDKTQRGFSCLYCAKPFPTIDDLRRHTAQKAEKDKINTMIDYKLSYNPIKVDITNLRCTVCNSNMRDLTDLKDHLVAVHNKVIYKDIKDIILPFRLENGHNFTCVICSVVHISFKNLYHHMSSHYRNYCCKKCGAGYITIAALRKHGKTHYQGNFPCAYCDKTYTSLTKKRNHEKGVHTGGWLRNKCPHCPEIFVSYYDRSEHMVKVHNATPTLYPCNACNKTYKKKFELNRHIKHHHLQQKSFLCDKCNAKFYSKRGLADHLTRHDGGEICSCDVCGKTFSRLRTLKEHLKIHEDDKRYQCEVCKKNFVQKCSLKSHMRLHQDDLDIFKEFDDVKHLVDDRAMTLKEIAEENKKKKKAAKETKKQKKEERDELLTLKDIEDVENARKKEQEVKHQPLQQQSLQDQQHQQLRQQQLQQHQHQQDLYYAMQ